MKFYQQLIKLYGQLSINKKYERIAPINKNINWYKADENKSLIGYRSNSDEQIILEIDIREAYPTLCHCCFPEEKEFLKKIDNIDEKLKKNIFLTNILKQREDVLKSFARMCKIIIFGIIISELTNTDDFELLEIKKDSCLLICNSYQKEKLMNLENSNDEFSKFIINNNFKFHITLYKFYMRHSKTSFFLTKDNLWKLKGNYKLIPEELQNIILRIVEGENVNLEDIKKIYTLTYFKIIKIFNLNKLLNKFYVCDQKILGITGKYEKVTYKVKVDPSLYLKLFITPVLIILSQETQ